MSYTNPDPAHAGKHAMCDQIDATIQNSGQPVLGYVILYDDGHMDTRSTIPPELLYLAIVATGLD